MSGGLVICPSDLEGARRYMEAINKSTGDLYWTDPEVIEIWIQNTMGNKKWLESMGGVLELYRHGGHHKVPGAEAIDAYRVKGHGPG